MKRVVVVLALSTGVLACSSGPTQGTEGGPCYPNGTCNGALTCLSNLCVNAGVDAGSEAGADVVTLDVASKDVAVDAPATQCTSYAKSTIAAMRNAAANGCFELGDVVTLAVTPATGAPRLFVQDAAGGDFSAIMAVCSSTDTTHPCSVASTVSSLAASRSVTIRGEFVVDKSTTLERLFIDSVTDNGAGAMPGVASATQPQVSRASTAANLRYQRVTVSLASALVMYDWSPAELAAANASSCPYQLGFGMIPQTASFTPGAACSNGTSQPAGQLTPDALETLIGMDFFQTYKVSSDCRCAKASSALEPSATSSLSGTLSGILVFDVAAGKGFTYVAPEAASDAPVTNTVMGQ